RQLHAEAGEIAGLVVEFDPGDASGHSICAHRQIRSLAHRGAGSGHFAIGSSMGTPDDLFGIRAAFSRSRDAFRFAPSNRYTRRGLSVAKSHFRDADGG